jgi:hypothetical protein
MVEVNVDAVETGTVASCIYSQPVEVSYTIKEYVTPGVRPVKLCVLSMAGGEGSSGNQAGSKALKTGAG